MTAKLLLVTALSYVGLLAQGSSTGMAPLKLPTQARNASLGEATAADLVATSFLSNPALLADANALTFSLSHEEWIQSIRTEFFSSIVPTPFGGLAFSVSSTNIPGIEIRDIPGPPLGEFSSRSAVLGASAGFQLDESISAGFTINYLYEKIFVNDANGYGIDVGAIYKPPLAGLKIGLSLLHAGSMNRLRNERANLPTSLLVGGSYTLTNEDYAFLLLATESSSLHENSSSFRAGLEASYLHFISVRLGYQAGFDSRRFSYGLGLHYTGLTFDYSYVPFSLDLGNSHLITIGFSL